jgi:hypothetical protein
MAKKILITNLMEVAVGNVRTHTNALLLVDQGPDESGPRYRAYGFHNEASNLIFDVTLPSFKWSIEMQEYKRLFLLHVAGKEPVTFRLLTDFANDAPLDIEQLVEDGERFERQVLEKVLRYYHAPYILLGQQLRAELARKEFSVEPIVDFDK